MDLHNQYSKLTKNKNNRENKITALTKKDVLENKAWKISNVCDMNLPKC